MDETEAQARKYLCECGYIDIVYEPDGNIPPDFLVDNTIAIEVSQLNIHFEHPQNREEIYAHKQYYPEVRHGLEKLLKKLGHSSNDESWYVNFSLAHPFPGWTKVKNDVKEILKKFKESEKQLNISYRIQNSLEISFLKCGAKYEYFYVMGYGLDDEKGCSVVSEIYRNLKIISDKKEQKVARYRDKYSEWWLILVDRISHGHLDSHDLEQLASLPKIESNWDKILVINPHNSCIVFEY